MNYLFHTELAQPHQPIGESDGPVRTFLQDGDQYRFALKKPNDLTTENKLLHS